MCFIKKVHTLNTIYRISKICRKVTVVSTTGNQLSLEVIYKNLLYTHSMHNQVCIFLSRVTDIPIMKLILMHIEPENNIVITQSSKILPLSMIFFFFQSTDSVNDLIVVIKTFCFITHLKNQ